MEKENIFSTRDISEGALLYCCNRKFIRMEHDAGKCWFVFEDKKLCQELINSYWRREALVDAKAFSDGMRTLKDLIFSRERR